MLRRLLVALWWFFNYEGEWLFWIVLVAEIALMIILAWKLGVGYRFPTLRCWLNGASCI